MNTTNAQFLAILGVVLLFLAVGCTKPPVPDSKLTYFEFVIDKERCNEPVCFLEYIVASDGSFLEKSAFRNGVDIPAEIFLGQLDSEQAASLLSFVGQNLQNQTEPCQECYRLYYSDGTRLFRQEIPLEPQNETLERLRTLLAEAKKTAVPAPDFFAKLVFKEYQKPTVDYHFFPSGLVIKEEFSDRADIFSGAELSIRKEKILELQNQVDDSFFDSQTAPSWQPTFNCLPDISYGYLEIKKNGKYASKWVCGGGNTAADRLFAKWYGEFK